MFRKIVRFLAFVLLSLGIIFLTISYLPLLVTPREVNLHYSYHLDNENQMDLNISYSGFLRGGFADAIIIDANYSQYLNDQIVSNKNGHPINLIYRIKISNLEITPQGDIKFLIDQNNHKKVVWTVRSDVLEVKEGTLWIFVEEENNGYERDPIYAIPIIIENKGVGQITYRQIQETGLLFILVATFLFGLLFLLKFNIAKSH